MTMLKRLMKTCVFLCGMGGATALPAMTTTVLSEGWRFHPGAAGVEAAAPGHDDTGWTAVRVPHDWAIAGPFAAAGDGGTGRLPWRGEGWYRHRFELPDDPGNGRVYFDFDGVMAFPTVYINGRRAGEWDYGYTSFRVDATPYVKWGGENVIAVHVDTRRWGSRWYPGAGIYRKVAMVVSDPVHVAQWGIQVRTNGDEVAGVAPDAAFVRTTISNHRGLPVEVTVAHSLFDPQGRRVAGSEGTLEVPAVGEATGEQVLEVTDPLLWDIAHPHLYTVRTVLSHAGKILEERRTRFGFRTFAFTADDGFHLNGRRVQLYGVNNHHDLGPLGAAFNRRAAERQLEILQEMGVNALRTAHNPPAPEVLELCDERGILVWNEVFDKYAWTAGRPDLQIPLPAFSQRHIAATVKRDFNHPSVVVWSTGNEVWPGDAMDGITPERVEMMAAFVRELDETRPVAQGCHIPGLVDGENFAALDLTGWNYARRYLAYREQYPDRPIIYSESASTLSTRGYFDPDLPTGKTDYSEHFQLSSYDLHAAGWSDIPDVEFRLMEEDAYVAGEFVWTGFDYLGEPTPFAAEARSSYFGIIDLCGFPKDRFYLYRSHWRPEENTVHLLPHWNWPDRVGGNVPVFVYTNGDSAELFLNGRSLGRRHKGEVPPRPEGLVDGSERTVASSAAPDHPAAAALDGDLETGWQPTAADENPSWTIDLGAVTPVAHLWVETPDKANDYTFRVEASRDAENWTTVAENRISPQPMYVGPTRAVLNFERAPWRHFRITFTDTANDAAIGLRAFQAFAETVENDYYDTTYAYRLRWNEVTYEPGELRAVAYRDGAVIGEDVVETVGAPVKLRLTVDRGTVRADGEDLAFITVEALDAEGRPHPLADDLVHFQLTGPGEIAAVGNGNPLSFEPFLADRRHLFFGKALLIVRPQAGAGGVIGVKATAPGLHAATVEINARTQP